MSESWFAIPRPTVICFTVRMYVLCSLVDNRTPFLFDTSLIAENVAVYLVWYRT